MTVPVSADPLQQQLQTALEPDYALERELGRGGMGAVYLARDLRLDRPVAIKLLPPELAVQPELRERFLRETRTAASFSHPNIVPVHAVEDRGGVLCFVMGFVDGETLAQRVRRAGPLSATDAVRVLQEMAWALSYAHGRGVVHRDIKPDNVLIERASGRALMTDFGISRSSAATGLTTVGQVVGTPQFMSPEQAAGEPVDGRSDLYSLGVVGYFALTGRLPFQADSAQAYLAMHLTRAPAPVAGLRPDLPAALSASIDRLLAKDPAQRFQSGEALAEALDTLRSARPAVPGAIRIFHVKAGQLVRNAILFVLLAPYLSSAAEGEGDQFILRLIVFAAAVALLMQAVAGLRDLAVQGFRYEDLQAGIRLIGLEQEETSAQLRASPAWRRVRRRRWAWTAFALIACVAMIAVAFTQRVQVGPHEHRVTFLGMVLLVVGACGGMATLVFALARSSGSTRVDRLLLKVWTSAFGRWLFAIAARGLDATDGRAGGDPASAITPGERGALTLFHELPKPMRRELRGIEPLIRRLDDEQLRLRQRESELDSAINDAQRGGASESTARDARERIVAELQASKESAVGRRTTAAESLERLRLELLRLKNGLGDPAALRVEIERWPLETPPA